MDVFSEDSLVDGEDDYFNELKKLRFANRLAQQVLVEKSKILNDEIISPSNSVSSYSNPTTMFVPLKPQNPLFPCNDENDNWGVSEYLHKDSFKYVQDYLNRVDHLLTMSDSIRPVAFPSSYETVSTSEELLRKSPEKESKSVLAERQQGQGEECSPTTDNLVSVNDSDKPKPLLDNFLLFPTDTLELDVAPQRFSAKAPHTKRENQSEPSFDKEPECVQLQTHRPTEKRFQEFISTRRNKENGQRTRSSESFSLKTLETYSAEMIQNDKSNALENSETPAIQVSHKKPFYLLNGEKEELNLGNKTSEANVNELNKVAIFPQSQLILDEKTKKSAENDSVGLHFVEKYSETFSVRTGGEAIASHATALDTPISVPKLNLSDIENGLSEIELEMQHEPVKSVPAAIQKTLDFKAKPAEQIPSLSNKKAVAIALSSKEKTIPRVDINMASIRPSAEAGSKRPSTGKTNGQKTRPSTAGNARKTTSAVAQRKWEKSCVAWSSFERNEMRTWSSVQLPKKKLPVSEKRKSPLTPFVAASSSRILPKFENSWLSLPEEVLLHIFNFMSTCDLFNVAKVCKTFERISHDSHLWRSVTVQDVKINDKWLAAIGNRTPESISMIGCDGNAISNVGLRTLFRNCKTSLTTLHVENCTGAQLSGDAVLLHASCHCRNLTHINVAWSRTTENGVIAIALGFPKILSLNINGNSAIGEEAFEVLTNRHAQHLTALEMSGCFSASNDTVLSLVKATSSLQTLNLGLCGKIPAESIIEMCPNLSCLKHLDLRGVKSVTNQCLHSIATQCNELETLIVSNCSQITDVGIAEIATYRNSLIHLDISGCSLVSNQGIITFLLVAKSIEHLDVSGTGATYVTVDFIANHNESTIKTLKLSFCHNITLKCLLDLLNVAISLKSLHLYGCKRIKLSQLMKTCKRVVIEK